MTRTRGLDRFQAEVMSPLDSVYRFALKLTRDECDAADLVQETYLIAFQHQQLYKLGTNCRAWLFTICRHHWLQQERRAKRVTSCSDSELESLSLGSTEGIGRAGGEEMSNILDFPEFSDVLHRALDALPEAYRMPVVIVDVEDQSYAAAAEIMGVPVGTVRSRLSRGRRMLQGHLLAFAQDAGLVPRKSSCECADQAEPVGLRAIQ